MDKDKIKVIIGSIVDSLNKGYQTQEEGGKSPGSIKYRDIKDGQITESFLSYDKNKLDEELEQDRLASINFIAEKIADMANRRDEGEEDGKSLADPTLYSIFNIINGNKMKAKYKASSLNQKGEINYPQEDEFEQDKDYYKNAAEKIRASLDEVKLDKDYINSLLSLSEDYLTYLPYENTEGTRDISLYDHLKFKAAIASCIYDYILDREDGDFSNLIKEEEKYYSENMFYLYSLDFSGIQNFIFDITKEKALKSLRTRSFYLEILLEIIIDDILDALDLTRANLIYSGGGHAYILIPNIEDGISRIEKIRREINNWLLENYNIKLYLAGGGTPCNGKDFHNTRAGAYKDIYKRASQNISEDKLNRYSTEQILRLNKKDGRQSIRECRVCKREELLYDGDDICKICDSIREFSKEILDANYFSVEKDGKRNKASLPLPFDRVLLGYKNEEDLLESMEDDDSYIRSYGKNRSYIGKRTATKLWIGDYNYSSDLNIYTKSSSGIERLAVLRADIDSLGQTLINGFEDRKASFGRSTSFSRNMSIFFKYHINQILANGQYNIDEGHDKRRKVMIVYSGGDDVFLVGEWSDVIGSAIDLNEALKKFTLGTLTISAGLGIYTKSYPLKSMALKTGDLEEAAKSNTYSLGDKVKEKNSISIFEEELTFTWEDFKNKVLNEKYKMIKDYLDKIDERGISFLYNLLELLRNAEDKLNIARLAYLLGRLEPGDKEQSEIHKEFSKKIYRYARDSKEKKELIAAIYVYVYKNRER